jgi:stringent starvation protein B
MKLHGAYHAIQVALENIWREGHTPRIQVDARRGDVVVPEHVRAKWGARLVLDLDANWPLNIEFGPKGIEVDLAFQGQVMRCTLPWESIYVVLDRATGRGIVVEAHVPSDVDPGGRADPAPADRRTAVRAEHAGSESPPEPRALSSDEEAKRRRARFRVIDGGGGRRT